MYLLCPPWHAAGTELLVWYGEEYAKDLGIEVTSAHLDYADSDDSSDDEPKQSKLHPTGSQQMLSCMHVQVASAC